MRKLNIGIIKRFFILCLMMAPFLNSRGAGNEDTKEKMMEIMLNDDYIFGEGVSDDREIAYGLAMDDLLIFANEIKGRTSNEKLSVTDLVTNVESLVYQDGSRFEVLVYLPMKLVVETTKKEPKAGIVIKKPGVLDSDEEDIEIEEEVVSGPETFMAQATPAEEEITPEVVADASEEISVTIENVSTPFETEEKTMIAKEPVKEEEVIVESPKDEPSRKAVATEYAGEVEDFLLTQDNFAEIKSFLSEMKGSGKITETGATDNLYGLPSDASLILMDELGGILAILSPLNSEGRINYKTHKADSENNYNSKFILWYKK